MKRILHLIRTSFMVLWKRHHLLIPPKYWKRYCKSFFNKIKNNSGYYNPFIIRDYNKWLKIDEVSDKREKFKYNPLISLLIPVYNIESRFLEDCLNSILEQSYDNFEICLADDYSTKKETLYVLKEYEKRDKRIKVVYRQENGHISKTTNSALGIATGEYIGLMDDDDILAEDALYEIVKIINKDKTIDFIYSDEDKLDMDGRLCEPHFKTDFALDSLFGGNYICHFTVIKRELINKIGDFKSEFVGAQDFDLFLRATEAAKKIYHIPRILYHWRKVPGSTADTIENKEYAIENGKRAVEEALRRRKLIGHVTVPIKSTQYVVHYDYNNNPLVSIIMLNNDLKAILNNLDEILFKSDYSNIEILINTNKKPNLNKYKDKKIFICNEKSINALIKRARGEHILVISGKIKIGSLNWINEMVGYSMQNEIGVVGPKIHNFDKTIKSAGQILSNKNIYIDAFSNFFCDSVGQYGRLLVPYNYSSLSNDCFMFSKDKYNKVQGFMEDINFDISSIDFCLKMLARGYRNVLLAHVFINQRDIHKKQRFEISENEKQIIRKLWNLDDNTYYNENLSKECSFMLDKVIINNN